MSAPANPKALALAAALAILALLPLAVQDTYARHLLILAFLYAAVAASWDLTLGIGGIFNFAHLAFFGLGVYAAAIAAKVLGLSPWLGLPAGMIVGAAAAAIVTVPVLRLKGIYIVLVTFAFSQLCLQLILTRADVTGGMEGIVSIPPLRIGDHNFARDGRIGYYYTGLALLAASAALLALLARSRFGVALAALRDNADYAASRGVNEARHRLLSMVASGAIAGAAGAFYALYLRVASPDVFGFGISSLVLSMVLVGGAGTIFGPIVAAFAVTLVSSLLLDIGAWRFVIVSALMIVVIRFLPGGLWGLVERALDALPDDERVGPRTAAAEPTPGRE